MMQMEPPDPVFFFTLLVLGTVSATLALALRRAEERAPDPQEFHARGGLDHMLTGVLAWTALVGFVFLSLAMMGALIAAAVLVFVLVFVRTVDFGDRLIPLYRLQMSFAAAGLLAAFILLVDTIDVIQGVPNA